MSDTVTVKSNRRENLVDFLNLNDFQVEDLENGVYRVTRDGELPVFLKVGDGRIYFEVDLGDISEIAGADLYFNLLDSNTDIQPVCFAIDTSNPEDARLVLVESREVENLDDDELLSVFAALELAADQAEGILSSAIKG